MALTPQWLDELRARTTLSALISRTVRLTRAGREFKACCPFHNEKSPSFYVNDEKGFYHCFGCQQHGDAIRWLTDHQGMAFIDAVRELAEAAGMEVPAADRQAVARAKAEATLHDCLAAAQAFYEQELAGARGVAARAYLARRGYPAEIIAQFGFGYAPDQRGALREALAQFPEALLVEAGLLISVDGREPYERFRDRLTLPIGDARGAVIGFGGRILAAGRSDAPKYLNSPETPVFEKGRTLFNLHRATPAARRRERVVVVEGYLDVVALATAGITEAVAPLGTALTEAQLERLWRLSPAPLLCFDGDGAGQRAAVRAVLRALPLLAPGRSLRIVTLPAGLDPDDIVRQRGAAAMEELLGTSRSIAEVLWDSEFAAEPLADGEAKARFKTRLLDHCQAVTHNDIRTLLRRELLDRFGNFAFARTASRGTPGEARRGGPGRPVATPLAREDSARLTARAGTNAALMAAVIEALIMRPERIARHGEALARLVPADTAIADTLDQLLAAPPGVESAALVAILTETGVWRPARGDWAGIRHSFLHTDSPAAEAQLAEAITLLGELPAVETALVAATRALEADFSAESYAEQQRLVKRRLAMLERIGQMAIPE